MGRGTTVVESALLDRSVAGCDVNPLSRTLVKPRLTPPILTEVRERLNSLDLGDDGDYRDDLTVFYHPDTLRNICGLRSYLRRRRAKGSIDGIDEWVEMVAVNRLTGHSPGFFSVYTLPPNQAVSLESQRKINSRRAQTPQPRDVRQLILNKTRSLLKDCDDIARRRLRARAVVRGSSPRRPARLPRSSPLPSSWWSPLPPSWMWSTTPQTIGFGAGSVGLIRSPSE